MGIARAKQRNSPARRERRLLEKHERINQRKGLFVEITTKQAIGSLNALGYLTSSITFTQAVGINFGIALKHCRDVNELYEHERKKLAKTFAKKKMVEGKEVIATKVIGDNEVADMDMEAKEKFDEAMEKLRAKTITIPVEAVKRSEIADEKILPFIYADLDWLIVPDAAPEPAKKK
jgi:hypothetical protein